MCRMRNTDFSSHCIARDELLFFMTKEVNAFQNKALSNHLCFYLEALENTYQAMNLKGEICAEQASGSRTAE